MYSRCNCSACGRPLIDGEDVYNIHGEIICEDCIDEFHETYWAEDPGVDDAVDEMRDLAHGW